MLREGGFVGGAIKVLERVQRQHMATLAIQANGRNTSVPYLDPMDRGQSKSKHVRDNALNDYGVRHDSYKSARLGSLNVEKGRNTALLHVLQGLGPGKSDVLWSFVPESVKFWKSSLDFVEVKTLPWSLRDLSQSVIDEKFASMSF
jgi:ribosomal protein L27